VQAIEIRKLRLSFPASSAVIIHYLELYVKSRVKKFDNLDETRVKFNLSVI
jgi:hypothetical protein